MPGGAVNLRAKVLRAARKLRHRYDLVRAASQAFTLAVLVAIPLAGLARVDVWGGRHRLLFAAASLKHALAGVVLGISATYVLTFLSNVFAGRVFCGWGCPVGQVSRFGEAAAAATSRHAALRAHAAGAAYSACAVVAMLAWWCDPRVLVAGAAPARAAAWGVVGAGVLLAYLHARYWRWEFCKQVCPIGLYYTFVSPARWFGIHFRDRERLCVECRACDNVCPVGLEPRDLWRPIPARGGLSVADAPGRNHCLECGDCVRACEMVLRRKRPSAPVPLHLGWYRGAQRETAGSDAAAGVPAEDPALSAAGGRS